MSEPRLCPQCGGEIPAGAPAGLCPKCLVLAGLESRPADGPQTAATQPPPSPSAGGFLPPTIEELAARLPQLEILELLGRGGMGAVYKARQRELDRLVAVKILPPEVGRDPAFTERFTREARAMARLSHPNIVAVYDFGKLPSRSGIGAGGGGGGGELFYFIMEYVDGVNLRQAIQSGGMDAKQALAIVPQICDALQFAHDEGVVHRDIKPENILIDKRGRVKIADFGLAKLLGQEAADHGLTATQQVMGTLRYMAPEQMEGTKSVDHRADIYSLGVVFYELLTGELPIGRFAPPSKMVEIDVRLDEVVLRALEKKPEQRYQHASEVKTDMESIAGSPAAAPAAASETPRPHEGVARANGPNRVSKIGRISLWLAVGGLVVPILLAVVAAALVRYGPLAEECFVVCIVLLYVLELAALVCGIVGWRAASGKAGVAISLIWLVFGGCGGISIYAYFMTSAPRAGTYRGRAADHLKPSAHHWQEGSDRAGDAFSREKLGVFRPYIAGKQVEVTAEEVAHILSELPKEFTKGLPGSNVEKIRELDTFVRAIDFDDGPADFWMEAYQYKNLLPTFPERLPSSFPERLPSGSESEVWHIPAAKARILMWIQPRQSVGMSDRRRAALVAMPPGCSLGIDVDGKPVARINYDVPKNVPNLQPLWFDFESVELPGPDAGLPWPANGRLMYFIGRQTPPREERYPKAWKVVLWYYRRGAAAGENAKGNQP